PREKHGRLACGISSADDNHILVPAEICLELRRSVVNTKPFESRQVGEIGLPIPRAARNDDRPRLNDDALAELHSVQRMIANQSNRRASNAHLGAELLGLYERPSCECLPRDACWKAEVVFNLRARTGLSSWSMRLEHQNIEPLGSGVDCRGK